MTASDVFELLRFFADVRSELAQALVLDEQDAGPEEINETVVAGDFLYQLLKLATCRRRRPKTSKNSRSIAILTIGTVAPE